MKEFHRGDFANRTGLAQAWTVKSADRLFTAWDLNQATIFFIFPRPKLPNIQITFLLSPPFNLF